MDMHAVVIFVLYAVIFILGMGFIYDAVSFGMNYDTTFYMLALPLLLPAFLILAYFKTSDQKRKILLIIITIISLIDIFLLMLIYSAY